MLNFNVVEIMFDKVTFDEIWIFKLMNFEIPYISKI